MGFFALFKHAHWWFITSQISQLTRPKCYPFHRDAYFPALLKRSSISNNVFIVWLWSLFTFCSGNSTFNAWSHLWIIIFVFCFSTLTSKNPMLSFCSKDVPCCTGIMCCSQHVCSLDAAFVLFNPIWSMVGLAFSLCCLFLLHGFIIILQTNKKENTNYTLLIFFNKEYSVFPNLQCASCWFPFIVFPLPCPYLTPLPPPPTTTSSPAVTKIDDFHASSITGPEWFYLLSFMVIVSLRCLKTQCATYILVLSLWPTAARSFLVCLALVTRCQAENIAGKTSRWSVWVCLKLYCVFKRTSSKCNVDCLFVVI